MWYILNINSLRDKSFANIFSHSKGCLSLCWLFPLLCKTISVWGTCTYIYLFLLSMMLVSPPKSIAKTNVKELFLCVSSRGFLVSGLKFKSLMYFIHIHFIHMKQQYKSWSGLPKCIKASLLSSSFMYLNPNPFPMGRI